MRASEFILEQQVKIDRVAGNKAYAGDGAIEIDLDQVDIAQDDTGETTIKPKKTGTQRANIRPGQTVNISADS